VLQSLIRILRASLAQIDTEMAKKYAKLGKAKFNPLCSMQQRRREMTDRQTTD